MHIRHRELVIICVLTLSGWSGSWRACGQHVKPGEEGADQYHYSMGVVNDVLSQPKGMHSTFVENSLARLGDSASVAVIKLLTEKQREDPSRLPELLYIIKLSFARPCIIDLDVDKIPNATLLLLKSLQAVAKDGQQQEQLAQLAEKMRSIPIEKCRQATE